VKKRKRFVAAAVAAEAAAVGESDEVDWCVEVGTDG